jgi:hypothetical protein
MSFKKLFKVKSREKPKPFPIDEISLPSANLSENTERRAFSINSELTREVSESTTSSPTQKYPVYRRVKSSPNPSKTGDVADLVWVAHNLGQPFRRYDHIVNDKGDEIYLFGGKVGDQPLNDLYRIDPGTTQGLGGAFLLIIISYIECNSFRRERRNSSCILDGCFSYGWK